MNNTIDLPKREPKVETDFNQYIKKKVDNDNPSNFNNNMP